MSLQNIISEKTKNSAFIRRKFKFQKKNKILWLVIIDDEKLLWELLEWINKLPANFIIITKNKFDDYDNIIFVDLFDKIPLVWFDFVVCDNCVTNLLDYLKHWVVPIVPKDNYLDNVLKEFNPIKSEWNAFFYNEINKWEIFYALARYIENYKFPYDNRNLIKNVIEIY